MPPTPATLPPALAARDLALDVVRVGCVLLVVLVHLLFVGVGRAPDGALLISRPLEEQPWFPAATWAGQIMPLFFVVGGIVGLGAWRRARDRGESAAAFARGRVLRLARPAFPFALTVAALLAAATALGIAPDLVAAVAVGIGSPLWFVGAYALCQALVPAMARAHERAPVRTLAALAAGAVAVDALRAATGITQVGYLNLALVWLLVQQLGFATADGWFARRGHLVSIGIVAAVAATLAGLIALGAMNPNMLDNLNPPTIALALLGLGQAALLHLAHPLLARAARSRAVLGVLAIAGPRLMTIYLWHVAVIVAVAGLGLLIPGASPEPGSAAWWLSRPIAYVLALAGVFGLSRLLGGWERLAPLRTAPAAGIVAIGTALVVIPAVLEIEFLLTLPVAIALAVGFGGALLLLDRRPAATGAADS